MDCHGLAANKWVRGQWLTGTRGQIAHFPTFRTSRSEIRDLRKLFQWCNATSPSAPTSCRLTPLNTATSNSPWQPSIRGRK